MRDTQITRSPPNREVSFELLLRCVGLIMFCHGFRSWRSPEHASKVAILSGWRRHFKMATPLQAGRLLASTKETCAAPIDRIVGHD